MSIDINIGYKSTEQFNKQFSLKKYSDHVLKTISYSDPEKTFKLNFQGLFRVASSVNI